MFWRYLARKCLPHMGFLAICSFQFNVQAAVLQVHIEPFKKKMQQGVVYLVPQFGLENQATIPDISIAQQDRVFEPYISVTQIGGKVLFPNHDSFSHHVYSFSKTQKFELPLYTSERVPELSFDTPGSIVLGCNIHDWMIGYLLILDTPFYTLPKTKHIEFDSLPDGEYELFYWHPSIASRPIKHPEPVIIPNDHTVALRIDRKIRHVKRPSPIVNEDSGDFEYDEYEN